MHIRTSSVHTHIHTHVCVSVCCLLHRQAQKTYTLRLSSVFIYTLYAASLVCWTIYYQNSCVVTACTSHYYTSISSSRLNRHRMLLLFRWCCICTAHGNRRTNCRNMPPWWSNKMFFISSPCCESTASPTIWTGCLTAQEAEVYGSGSKPHTAMKHSICRIYLIPPRHIEKHTCICTRMHTNARMRKNIYGVAYTIDNVKVYVRTQIHKYIYWRRQWTMYHVRYTRRHALCERTATCIPHDLKTKASHTNIRVILFQPLIVQRQYIYTDTYA